MSHVIVNKFIFVNFKIFLVSVTTILAAYQNVSLGQSTRLNMVQNFGALTVVAADASPNQAVNYLIYQLFRFFLSRAVAQQTVASLKFLAGTIDTGCGSSQWGEIGHVRGFEGQMIHGDDIYCQT